MVGDHRGGVELVGRPSWKSGSGRRPSRMSESVWETVLEVRKWSRDPPGGPELVGRPYRRSGSHWETVLVVWKWSGDPSGGPEVVGRPSRRSESGRETLSEIWN